MPGDLRRRRRSTRRSSDDARRVRQGRRPADEPLLLPLDRADVLPGHRRASSASSELNRHEGADVRVVIEKPFGTTLAEAERAQPRGAVGLRRAPGLPHRPLPGQGDGPEHDGVPVRQRACSSRCGTATTSTTIQITAAEDLGIGSRAGYYDSAGALRDLIQNHMLQLLCHVAMEPPVNFTADEVRNEKVKVLHAIHAPTRGADRRDRRARAVRRGRVGRRARRRLPARRRASRRTRNTETYAALRLEVDNWRWAGVPFYLRTGKRLARKVTEIAVTLQAGAAPGLHAGGLARRAAQPADPHHAAQRGRVAVARGEDPRARACGSAR